MKILYIMPTQYTPEGRLFRQKKAFFPSLTLPYLAGLTPKNVGVEMRNDYIESIVPEKEKWDLVAITITTPHAIRGYALADAFRALGVPVVMGGAHATFRPDEALKHCDAVVVGEAEYSLPKLITDFQHNRLKRQYTADTLHPLENLPSPRYDLIPYRKYRYRAIPIQTSRGCPHNCRYCTVTALYGRKYRFRPIDEVVEELNAAKQTIGSKLVYFIDDNIAANKNYAYRLFEALLPLGIYWVCQCAITMADEKELLRLAVKAGMRGAFIGLESLNSDALKQANKNINKVETYDEKLDSFKKAGVSVSANLIFGFEDDTASTFSNARAFISSRGIYANPYILTPYPGTQLFTEYEDKDRLRHKDWHKYTAYQQVIRHDHLKPAYTDRLFWDMYQKLYSPWQNMKRVFRRPIKRYFSIVDWYLQIRVFFYNATFISRRYLKKKQPPYF